MPLIAGSSTTSRATPRRLAWLTEREVVSTSEPHQPARPQKCDTTLALALPRDRPPARPLALRPLHPAHPPARLPCPAPLDPPRRPRRRLYRLAERRPDLLPDEVRTESQFEEWMAQFEKDLDEVGGSQQWGIAVVRKPGSA